MKKSILLIGLTFVCLFSFSQVNTLNILPVKDGEILYSGTLQVDNTTQKEINIRAKRWFVLNFGDISEAAITYQEPEGGMLIGKAGVAIYKKEKLKLASGQRSVWFTIQFTITDNKCIYEFQKFRVTSADKREYYTLESFGKFGSSENQNEYDFLVAIDTAIKTLILSMGKTIDPNRFGAISSYLQKFDSYSQKGDTSSALKTIKEAYDKFPEDIAILGQLIECYIRAGKAAESIIYLDKAIAMEKDNSSAIVLSSYYHAKGSALEKMGKQDEAIKEYEAAIKVKADYLGAYWNIAVIYYNRGYRQNDDNEFAKSVPYFEKALECDPNNTDVKNMLKNLYNRLKMTDKLKKIK